MEDWAFMNSKQSGMFIAEPAKVRMEEKIKSMNNPLMSWMFFKGEGRLTMSPVAENPTADLKARSSDIEMWRNQGFLNFHHEGGTGADGVAKAENPLQALDVETRNSLVARVSNVRGSLTSPGADLPPRPEDSSP